MVELRLVGGLVGLLCWRCAAWEAPCAMWPRCWLVDAGLGAVSSRRLGWRLIRARLAIAGGTSPDRPRLTEADAWHLALQFDVAGAICSAWSSASALRVPVRSLPALVRP
jgi:hypothetical protein